MPALGCRLPMHLVLTTIAIGRLHIQIQKIVNSRGLVPTDETAAELLFLALRDTRNLWYPAPE